MPEQCDIHGQCCPTKENTGEHCDMPAMMLELADAAWIEVMKEKIKAEIVKSCSAQMDQIAKLVAEANHAKWTYKIQGKLKCAEYEQNLKALFTAPMK